MMHTKVCTNNYADFIYGVYTRSAIQIKNTLSMTNGGFKFLLLPFQYPIVFILINLVISMNYRNRNTLRVLQLQDSACWVHYENYLPAVVPTARRQGSSRR